MLDDICKECVICQQFHSGTFRFRASLPPDEIVLNQEVAIDLVWLDGRPVMHVVDTHTNFQNAGFVKSKSVNDLWWSTVEMGYPRVNIERGLCTR